MAAAMVVSGSHEMLHSPVIAVCKSLFAVFAFHGIGIAPDADLSLILVVYHQQFTRPLHDLAASDHSVTADKALYLAFAIHDAAFFGASCPIKLMIAISVKIYRHKFISLKRKG